MGDAPNIQGLSRARGDTDGEIPLPRRRWRTRVAIPAGILVAIVGLVAYSAWDTLLPATEVRAVSVIVKSIAGDAPGSVAVQAPGWLEPDPHPFYVAALTSGVVEEVLILEGATVEAGDVFARLIDDDARLARESAVAEVAERRGSVAAAKADLDAATQTMASLIDRTEAVDRSRADLEAVAAERTQLDAEIQSAESIARGTEDELDRKSRLVSTQAVSQGEVVRLRLRLTAERATVKALRAGIPVLQAKSAAANARLVAATRRAKLLIDERRALGLARANLATAEAAERKAIARLGEADLRLERTKVRATRSGVVLERLVSPGSRVDDKSGLHGTHVAHLYDPLQLQVRVDIPLADAAQVGVGQPAEIVVDALPDRVFHGKISRLVHLADVAKNTIEVKVAVTDPIPLLKPEMLARVRFMASPKDPAEDRVRQRVFAPRSAVRSEADGDRVFAVSGLRRGRGRVEVREVTIGRIEVEDYIEITSGLRPGDHVIIDAPPGLGAGSRVVIVGGSR